MRLQCRVRSLYRRRRRLLSQRITLVRRSRATFPLTVEHLTEYQNARLDAGRAPKTINGELSVIRQLLKHAKLWYRFDDYEPIANTKPPVGKALTEEEQERLFDVAQSRSDWLYAYTAAILGAYCACAPARLKRFNGKTFT
jgi:site-specific recombinase XerD